MLVLTRRSFLAAAPAAAIPVAVPPARRPAEPDDAAWRASNASRGHADLMLLAGLLATAKELAEAVADEHPDGCPCPYCRAAYHHRAVMADLPFLAWQLDRMADEVAGGLARHVPLVADTFAADLRTLTAFAESLDD